MPTAEGGLIVFLRLPRKGYVKTRLAESIGPEKALDIYSRLVEHTISIARSLQYPTYFFYEGGLPDPSSWLPSAYYFLQSEGDLGQRMQEAISHVLKNHSKAVIIGSDCPGLTSDLLQQAFTGLDTKDIMIGPATDGGYYLLGCKKITPVLFEGIEWSSPSVMRDTLQRCIRSNLSYASLPELRDIDTLEDYLFLRHQLESE
jgi:uncharacterized protein